MAETVGWDLGQGVGQEVVGPHQAVEGGDVGHGGVVAAEQLSSGNIVGEPVRDV